MNMMLVFRSQTTVQSFIKFDPKIATTGAMTDTQTDRRQRSYNLSHAML